MPATPDPRRLLGGLSPGEFLERHWQQRPLLVRAAWPDLGSPIAPEDLAALACTEEAEARLVWREPAGGRWQQRWGPFDERDFATLGSTGWTLLVQEVDRYVSGVADLLEPFRFVPNWRLDDVLVSYAVRGGGVGPHVDRYDVFLLQGPGRRRWRIESRPLAEEILLPDTDLRVLAEFRPDEEWLLGPGDLLYLPPGFAHEGVAEDACTTYSIGFRAPAHRDLLADLLAEAIERTTEERLYGDPGLEAVEDPGRIAPTAIRELLAVVRAPLRDELGLQRWLGRFLTRPRRGHLVPDPGAPSLSATLARGGVVRRSAPAHFAYIDRGTGPIDLFVGGESFVIDRELAAWVRALCGREPISPERSRAWMDDPALAPLLAELWTRGFLRADDSAAPPASP